MTPLPYPATVTCCSRRLQIWWTTPSSSHPHRVRSLCVCCSGSMGRSYELRTLVPGIGAAERNAVWKRFYRSDRSRHAPGMGLGLSLVAAIVKLHGFRLAIV